MNGGLTPQHTLFTVFVPANTNLRVEPASAIVAPAAHRGSDLLQIHFEGNRAGADNLRTLLDRCRIAAGRAAYRFPTPERAVVVSTELVPVAEYDLALHRITRIDNPEALAQWLGETPIL